LYLLQMAQKGLKSQAGAMNKGMPELAPPSLPSQGRTIGQPPQEPYSPPMVPEGAMPDEREMPELMMEEEEEEEDLLADEMLAQDVVEPVIHQPTFDEEMEYNQAWIENTGWLVQPVVTSVNHQHGTEDDIDVVLTENSFGGNVEIAMVEPTLEVVPELRADTTSQEIRINGIGPRRNTDSNRLKAIQQKARSEMFSQSRNVGPMREEISRWKTTEERMIEKEKKKKLADKKARQSSQMRGRDYGKLGAPSAEMLEAPTAEAQIEPEKIKPKKKTQKKAEKKKPVGTRKSERLSTSSKVVEINNLKLIILKLTKREEVLKKQGKKLSNNQFKVLLNAEQKLAKLLE
jgi:hypothetical protein